MYKEVYDKNEKVNASSLICAVCCICHQFVLLYKNGTYTVEAHLTFLATLKMANEKLFGFFPH